MGCSSYQSVALIEVYNPILGAIYYITLFIVMLYVVGYTVIIDKGYQFQEPLVANVKIHSLCLSALVSFIYIYIYIYCTVMIIM